MAATAQQEVESLDRVLTRLATTEEDNLEKVRPITHTCTLYLFVVTATLAQERGCSFLRSGRFSAVVYPPRWTAGVEQAIAYCDCSAEVSS